MGTMAQELASIRGQLARIERRLDDIAGPTTASTTTGNAMAAAQHERFTRDQKRTAGQLCDDCGATGWVIGPEHSNIGVPCPCHEGDRWK